MDYLVFILLILFLIFVLILLSRIDQRTRNKWRKSAYDLLEMEIPDREEVLKTIKHLRLYGGRIRRDKESQQLISRLHERLDAMGKTQDSEREK